MRDLGSVGVLKRNNVSLSGNFTTHIPQGEMGVLKNKLRCKIDATGRTPVSCKDGNDSD